MEKTFIVNGNEIKVQNFSNKEGQISFTLEGKSYAFKLLDKNGPELIIEGEGRFRASAGTPNRDGESMVLAHGSEAIISASGRKLKKDRGHGGGLTSPMPGKIFKILKPMGQEVDKGETILVLEAMKMEHSIRADRAGKVKKINFQEGELVQGGVVLVELE